MKLLRVLISVFLLALAIPAFANITSTTNRTGPYTTLSLPATLSVVFPFQQASDLLVLNLGQGGTTNDPAVVLTLNSDYTVTGGGYNVATNMQSGNVVVVGTGAHLVVAGDQIVILRNVPVNQLSSLTSGILTAAAIEKALDKQATVSQQLTETVSRGIRFEQGETLDGTLVRNARAGKLLGFDANGNISYSTGGGGGGGTQYTAGSGLLLNSNVFSVNPILALTTLTVVNPIVGSVTGNSATATALQNSRTINGVGFNGTANITVAASAATLTGTSLASNVLSSSLTSVAAGTIGSMAVQNAGSVAITGGAISNASVTGLAAPTNPNDAATKAYADSISAGITPRTGVLVATTANIALNAPQTIDGVAVIAGNRVLVKNQAAPAQNGIYDVAAGAWTRSSDSNTAAKLLFGYYYFVSSGATQVATSWFIQTPPAVLGVDPVVFSQFSASASYTAGTGLNLASNQFSIAANQSALNITSSAFNGTVGATTPSTGVFTQTTTTGNTYASNLVLKGGQVDEQATNGLGSVDINFDGYAGGTTQFRNMNIYDGKNGLVGTFTGQTKSLNVVGGINSTTIGATTPATIQFTTASSSSNANLRTTKGNLHLIVNVRDYGAVGDGAADDTAAINAAIGALANYSSLFFPAGNYKITGSLTGFTGLSYIRVYGDNARIFSNVTGAAGNTFVADATCSFINFDHLSIVGSATIRGSGIHIRLYSSYSSVTNCYLQGCSDFAIHCNNTGCRIENNTIVAPLGDGIHFGEAKNFVCVGNNISGTGDDGIGIIADTAGLNPERGVVVGNHIYNTGSAGIRINEVNDLLVEGNTIETTPGSGIEVNRYTSTTFYNARVHIKGNKLVGTQTTLGPRGAIIMDFCNESSVTENEVYDPANGSGISFLDFNDLVIRGNTIRGSPTRAIASDDTTTLNVAVNWYGLIVDANVIQWNQANEAIYAVPAGGITINNVLITSNVANQLPAGNWIFYNRVTTGKVGNNTSRDGLAVAAGGTVAGVTAFNNN